MWMLIKIRFSINILMQQSLLSNVYKLGLIAKYRNIQYFPLISKVLSQSMTG